MTLQEILFGTFQPPENAKTRSHRIGFASSFRYTEPNKRAYISIKQEKEKDPNHKSPSQKKVHKVLEKAGKPMTANEVAKKTNLTRNFCSIIMASLFKEGFAKRTKISANGTRYYAYQMIKK